MARSPIVDVLARFGVGGCSRSTASRSRASSSAGSGGVEDEVVDAPSPRDSADQAALGEHGDHRHVRGDRRQHPAEGLGARPAPGARRRSTDAERAVDQGAGVQRQHRHPVHEQAERGQHLGGRLRSRGQQEQIHARLPSGGPDAAVAAARSRSRSAAVRWATLPSARWTTIPTCLRPTPSRCALRTRCQWSQTTGTPATASCAV